MKQKSLNLIAALLVFTGLQSPYLARANADVVPVTESVAGKTYAQWGVEWYRWDLSNPTDKASSLDPTGANSSAGQAGPVWFLAGKSGGQEPVTRNVVVPAGKYIFFPIINVINDYPCPDATFQPAPGQSLEAFLAGFAKSIIDTTVDLGVEIDGQAVANVNSYRAASGLINFTADPSWTAFDSCITGSEQQAVVDGYWLMLRPLSAGEHVIKLRGKNFIPGDPPSPFGNQDVTLHVSVVPPAVVMPSDSHPYGRSYAEWQAKWWQWAISIPFDGHHPGQDESGVDAARGQIGPVWFLTGVFNSSGSATRDITVPSGKALFFPVLNGECSTVEAPPFLGHNETELRECVRLFRPKAMLCEIDGRPVSDLDHYDGESVLFNFDAPPNNLLIGNSAASGQAVDRGNYLMVPPLSLGSHTLRFGGTSGSFSLAITYHITIAPEQFPGFENHGLVGVGRVPAASFDKLGAGVDTLGGFFSSMSIDQTSITKAGSTLSGTLYGLSDRGWSFNSGAITFDYHNRLEGFDFSVTPYYGLGPVPQTQIALNNSATKLFTYDKGTFFTGADSGAIPATPTPTSPTNSVGMGHRSLDSEGITRAPDGGWFLADEYGPLIYRFNAASELVGTLFPPEAYLPKRGTTYPATLNYTGTNAPNSGRRNNRGFEGVTLTPDGKRLAAILQSPLVQDGGRSALSQNTRLLLFDVEDGSGTYGQPVAEYIYQHTLNGNPQTNQNTVLSDVLALGRERFLIIERDAAGLNSGNTNAPLYKRIVLVSTAGATNIINTGYDLERGAPSMTALPTNALPSGLRAMQRHDLVDLLNGSEISRFGLNARGTMQDSNTIAEKWEGFGLVPLSDVSAPEDYLLLVGMDNDFTAPLVYHNGQVVATNEVPVDTLVEAWRVTLPGLGSPPPANTPPSLVFTGPNNATLSAPARVDLAVSGYDQDGKITKVEFFEGATKLGEDTTFPFSLRLNGVTAGSHAYRAACIDNSGATAEATKTVVVTADNLPPVVALKTPADGTYTTTTNVVALSVTTSDPDGYIARVEYYNGATKLGESTSGSFSLNLTNLAVGVYAVSAVTYDNQGASATSGTANLRVLPPSVLAPGQSIASKTYGQWAAAWWQWVLSIPDDGHHPLKDETGTDAHRNQSGPVWFLGGVINTSGTATRNVFVPEGKLLFFPVLNVECSTIEAPPYYGSNEAELRACAEGFPRGTMNCEIDGISVPDLARFAVTSPLFDFNLATNNILGVERGGPGQAVDSGVYVMVQALPLGTHTVHFRGSSPDASFTLDITYHITVIPKGVVPPFESVAGRTYGEWGAEWYKWDLGNPTNRASSIDATGANMPYGQHGPVWFLAGSTVGGIVDRHVVVPGDKHVFFPVINIINDYPCPDASFQPAPGQSLEDFLVEFAKSVVDTTQDFYLEIDGVITTNAAPYRARSSLFEFVSDPSWAGIDACTTNRPNSKGVADGYWVMLQPLSPGQHTLRFRAKDFIPGPGGTLSPFGDQDITYHITVPPSGVLPPYVEVAGRSQAAWSGAWWQWALSQGTNTSPLLDRTGANANVRQYGDVFFLSGLLGYTLDPVTASRTFTVPAGKHLFFPVLNGAADNIDVVPPVSEQQLRDWAAGGFDSYRDVFAVIDGKPVTQLTDYRQRSPSYGLVLPKDNVFQPLSPGYQDGVVIEDQISDGIWVMLSPLSPGDHTVAFGGKNTFGWSLAVTNRITVVAPPAVPPTETYFGKTYGEWGGAWWKWTLELPYSQNPILDPDGRFGHLGQTGDVWFLAGTFGAKTNRSLVVPHGKSLFFPLINTANDYPCPDPNFKPAPGQTLEAFLQQVNADAIAGTTNLFVEVDGVSYTNLFAYRGISPLFNFTADISLKRPDYDPCITGSEQQMASDGYWFMLKPLTAGTHTLRLGGGHTTFGVDVTYQLTVLPPGLLAPYQTVAGVSQGTHSANWWIWASEQSSPVNPLMDTTGAQANNNQAGPVFYLGGTFGPTSDPNVPAATRHFRVPAGRHLFFPMLNVENDNITYDPDVSVLQLQADAKGFLDNPLKLLGTIDGIPVPNPVSLRVVSPEFAFTLPVDNIYKVLDPRYVDGMRSGSAVSDGYWLMSQPLGPGTHVIEYGGQVQSGFTTAVRAFVDVVPEGIPFISRVRLEAGNARIQFWAATSGSHRVETASEVAGPWTAVGAAVVGDGAQHEVILPATAGRLFFRLQRD